MEVPDPLAQRPARRVPGQSGEIGPADVLHQRGGRLSAGLGAAVGAAQLDRAEPPLDPLDEIVTVVVPHE